MIGDGITAALCATGGPLLGSESTSHGLTDQEIEGLVAAAEQL